MAGKIESLSDSKDALRKNSLHVEDFSTVVEGARECEFWEPVGKKNKDFDCNARSVMVFWDVKQCPVPCSEIPCAIRNISSALDKLGFHCPADLHAYGDNLDQKDDFYKAGICYKVQGQHMLHTPIANTRDYGEMAVDLINFASPTYDSPAVLMVIPKPDPDTELHRVLMCLESRIEKSPSSPSKAASESC
ncbi:unnamed protein product [Microthlaspi erraticum]|uniref:Uncharacterized protein n=1 Tax=Microthlaspi erraticum TaxID=1685480 RepID=A0A6D2IW21_9BRAS|nr:unnamed protein product [Microthlaspi erraticum]